jgi:hypothetical protein
MKLLKTMKRKLKDEAGQALAMALIMLVLGGLLVVPTLAFMTTNLTANRIIDEKNLETYAADAGIQYAYWRFLNDVDFNPATDPLEFPPELNPVNECNVTLDKQYVGDFTYRITSVAYDPVADKTTTIEAYFLANAAQYEAGPSPFDYAVATLGPDGTLTMGPKGSSTITCDPPPPPYEGNVYVTGDIVLGSSNKIYGTATLTGNCNIPGNVLGGVEPGDPLERPAWLDTKTTEFIASTAVTVPTCSGTTYSSWTPAPGTYNGAYQVTGDMTISGNGTYTFTGPVCVGGRLSIQNGANFVTFQQPVKVNSYVSLIGNGRVEFQDTLYIGGYLECAGSRSAKFKGQVAVNGGSRTGDYIVNFGGNKYDATYDVVFEKTLRATEPNLTCYLVRFGSGRTYTFYDVIYTTESIVFDGASSTVNIARAIVADCNINISNGAKALSSGPETMPFYISTHGGVNLTGDVEAMALVYAPEGQAYVDGSSKLTGALVAKSAWLKGNVTLKYPVLLRDRDDIHPGQGGEPGESLFSIVSYEIDPPQ